jgi:hypothetical protein
MEGLIGGSSVGKRLKEFFSGSVATVLLLVLLLLNLLVLGMKLSDTNLPEDFSGFDPVQPVQFSHLLHSGEMQIPCVYCHPGGESQEVAGVVPAKICMNCHRFVQATMGAIREEERVAKEEGREPIPVHSTEIEKIYKALGLDWEQNQVGVEQPIRWIRVHDLPDYTAFHHGVHAAAGNECAECHGEVEKMERVRQVESLSMGWCVECHRLFSNRMMGERTLKPSTDCGGCHY